MCSPHPYSSDGPARGNFSQNNHNDFWTNTNKQTKGRKPLPPSIAGALLARCIRTVAPSIWILTHRFGLKQGYLRSHFCSDLFRSSNFSFLVFGHFWQRSYENTKILRNLCLRFARQDGQDREKRKENHTTKVTKIPKT